MAFLQAEMAGFMKYGIAIVSIIFCLSLQAQLSDSIVPLKFGPFGLHSETHLSAGGYYLIIRIYKDGQEILTDSVLTNLATCSGFSMPQKQPFSDYFIFCRRGAHNGKTYILTKTGDMRVIPGGSFWAAPKDKLLFILAERDYTNLLIYDLNKMKPVLEKYNCDEFSSWYNRGGLYLGKVLSECGDEESENDVSGVVSRITVEQFDIKTRSLNEMHVSDELLERSRKLARYGMCK
jgi:hypothetical protein